MKAMRAKPKEYKLDCECRGGKVELDGLRTIPEGETCPKTYEHNRVVPQYHCRACGKVYDTLEGLVRVE